MTVRAVRPQTSQKSALRALSDCQKSLAEFAPAGANKFKSVFRGGVYVEENTFRPESVRVVRHRRTASARSRPHPSQKSDAVTSDCQKTSPLARFFGIINRVMKDAGEKRERAK